MHAAARRDHAVTAAMDGSTIQTFWRSIPTVDRNGMYRVISVPNGRVCAMPTFASWYAVFLFGGAVGVTAGSSFGNGLVFIASLLGGMALSGCVAQQLCPKRLFSSSNSEQRTIQPASSTPQASAKGLNRVRFASAHPGVTATPDTFGPLWLPKGMYDFAMQKRIEKQTSSEWAPRLNVETISRLPAAPGIQGQAANPRSLSVGSST